MLCECSGVILVHVSFDSGRTHYEISSVEYTSTNERNVMRNASRAPGFWRLAALLFALLAMASAQANVVTANSSNPNPELVGQLTNQLRVTPEQATGGTGAIFGLVKSRLNPADFSQVAASVPGMDGFLQAAPVDKAGSTPSTLTSLVPSVLGPLPTGADGMDSVANSFHSLGLSPKMAGKFVPILKNYIASQGGPKTADLFANALK